MTFDNSSGLPLEDRETKIRQAIAAELLDFWQKRYTEYIEDRDTDEQIWDDRELNPEELSENAYAAYQFYRETVEMGDWGSVRAYRMEVEEEAIEIIYVVTDGDDGWLEAYDLDGNLLGAARRYIELLAWRNVEDVRGQVETGDFPPELNCESTLWGRSEVVTQE
ncbi:MAG: hypothetical protein F6K23_34115 [Okeania sp. SIO2C9]|uniref:hypothetical protein n=1 Tax=Okeania sp. SIO2C9 TaxID=2607791 RepID=UPI0013C184AB|nr:hypothetical protein [Okeania sp. SIO2C9]NEQ77609.1 hypothetical protein [Okeania sp. SIO2C9]